MKKLLLPILLIAATRSLFAQRQAEINTRNYKNKKYIANIFIGFEILPADLIGGLSPTPLMLNVCFDIRLFDNFYLGAFTANDTHSQSSLISYQQIITDYLTPTNNH